MAASSSEQALITSHPHSSQPRASCLRVWGSFLFDPNDLVTLEELALSNMWETSALVELLERKGILTKQEVLDMIQERRQREPITISPRRPSSQ